ncbi:hypothetical protein AMATHDRAFT_7650 [Amanita thiersii Skay4041]|uniref:Uncharacterized protein n=1 Tax=Amanita thiersii Skay4041 TaxID=703135 RepID=A0A2A9NG09_9AGAR|nr:hypothetical protein AMATHDRAFT_7650 [Amanita thiersii Skay4041]
MFNEAKLKPYTEPNHPGQTTHGRPPPEIVGEQEEYEVEELLDIKESTWEPAENMTNALEKVKAFHNTHPATPRPITLRHFEFKHYKNLTKPHIPRKLFGWEDGKFEADYLEKLERNWRIWKGARAQANSL